MTIQAEAHSITPPNNSAWRCYLYLKATQPNRGANVASALASAFAIPNFEAANPDHRELLQMSLHQFRRHTKLIIQALEAHHNVMPELYQPIRSVYDSLSAINNLDAPLTNYPPLLDTQCVVSMGWAATFLPAVGDDTDYDEISSILQEVMALKARLAIVQLPPTVLEFADQLFQTLERQIVEANFTGQRALGRAYRQAEEELRTMSEDLRASAGQLTAVQRDYLAEAATTVERIGKVAGGFSTVIKFANEVKDLIVNAI